MYFIVVGFPTDQTWKQNWNYMFNWAIELYSKVKWLIVYIEGSQEILYFFLWTLLILP